MHPGEDLNIHKSAAQSHQPQHGAEKDGLEGATIPHIAARAGLTPGAVYRRFPDKDALLRELCMRKGQEMQIRTFHQIGDLLLTRKDEIRHPDPEFAVRFGMIMVSYVIQSVFLLPTDPKKLSKLVPGVEENMEEEVPKMFLRYLGVEDKAASS